jgi:hypothetical protein
MKTFGQAVDAAIARHETLYPGSETYSVYASESELVSFTYRVEIRASHFSAVSVYYVNAREAGDCSKVVQLADSL